MRPFVGDIQEVVRLSSAHECYVHKRSRIHPFMAKFNSLTFLRLFPPPSTRGLNPSQEVALSRALSRQCTLIQGPPGTGKTFTSACLIEALVALDERRPESEEASEQRRTRKILATAHSNVATDNIMERLLKAGVSVIRIGKVCARNQPTVPWLGCRV
jgi:DNA polymerase III delta prime subunit